MQGAYETELASQPSFVAKEPHASFGNPNRAIVCQNWSPIVTNKTWIFYFNNFDNRAV